ncbi:ABC transporter permease [Paenibacillus antri]|uniref:ABC transporter permease n=1 Tax=Paenibacillus antri TaxID=2582848 RepID=A0A5R9G1K8_9BACL|nr:ABC transporter permease [Paenibacillus antri]TLS50222.1 ABC transporter permease [Paenibacillus antri]
MKTPLASWPAALRARLAAPERDRTYHPFSAMVRKELSDHIRSWRTNILLLIVGLTCIASIYAVLNGLDRNAELDDTVKQFLFLRLFTATDGTIPSFITFVGFLGPLLGIGMGFDAIQNERGRGTLSRTLAQPVPRDYIINAKFVAALAIVGTLFVAMGFLVMALGILMTGIPPTPEQFARMFLFLLASVVYVAFWLNLSILFSVRMRSAATSALSGLGLWIFFVLFYPILVNVVVGALSPPTEYEAATWTQWLLRVSPNALFQEATSTLLVPEMRTISGFLTMEQAVGAIPAPLPLGQSLLLVWPQMTALVAGTLICFGISYLGFMRQEIRAR